MTMCRSSLLRKLQHSPRISAIFRAGSVVCGGYGMFRFAHGQIGPSDPDRAGLPVPAAAPSAARPSIVCPLFSHAYSTTRFPRGGRMITLCGASLGRQTPSHLSPGLGGQQIGLPSLVCTGHGRYSPAVELAESWKSEAWDARGWDSLWAAREGETRGPMPASRPPGKGSRGPRYLSPCLPLGPHHSRLWGKLPQMGGRRSTDAIRHVCLARFIASSPSPARGPSPRRPGLAWLLMAQDHTH